MNSLAISSLTCALLAASCLAAPSSLPASGSNALTQAINSFSLDLFDQIARSKGQENVFLSPYSVSTVLSMLLAGAKGSTADQLIKSLHLETSGKVNGLQLISEAIHNKSEDASLALANYLLMQQEPLDSQNTVLAKYKSDMESLFAAKVDDVDFISQGPSIQSTVNDWVKEKTHGLISKILDELPSSGTILMLLNAIYFKGSWEEPFDPSFTDKRTFYNKGVNGIQTDFMQQVGRYNLWMSENLKGTVVKIVELPYANQTYAMTIVLPEERDGLTKLLSAPDFKDQMLQMMASKDYYRPKVNLKLPKFKLETEYNLVPALQGLGVNEIFEGGDLSGIRGTNNLKVSTIKHKAVVKVDEKGSEAAAVTWGIMEGASLDVERVWDVTVDHPFLFFIKDKQTDMILFVGKVEDL